MRCADCGQEGFPNVAAVTKHKKEDCPALVKGQDNVGPGAPVEGGAFLNEERKETKEPTTVDPIAAEMDRQEKLNTIHNYARSLGLEFVIVDQDAPKEPSGTEESPITIEKVEAWFRQDAEARRQMEQMIVGAGVHFSAPKEPTIDVSHLPKDTLAGLHRNAELKFEVLGVLDNDNLLHVHDVRYPRRGR